MSDESKNEQAMIVVKSTRFGDLEVPADSVIDFPKGVIGFPRHQRYVMIEHKPPFSWLHSLDDPALAFVVVDGFEFGQEYNLVPPIGDADANECDFKAEDEYAILVIVTVRPDPKQTTANLKAPLFVNLRNRKGAQCIFDDPRYLTRFPLWTGKDEQEAEKKE